MRAAVLVGDHVAVQVDQQDLDGLQDQALHLASGHAAGVRDATETHRYSSVLIVP